MTRSFAYARSWWSAPLLLLCLLGVSAPQAQQCSAPWTPWAGSAGSALSATAGASPSATADVFRAFSLREADRRLRQGDRDKELLELGQITRVAGMVYDREHDDIILVGRVQAGARAASLDDLAVALHARLVRDEWPLVSIDATKDTAKTGQQEVRFEGGLANRHAGDAFLNADVLLKQISLGLAKSVPALQSYIQLREQAARAEMEHTGHPVKRARWWTAADDEKGKEWIGRGVEQEMFVQSRFWFTTDLEHTFVTALDDVYVIDALALKVKAEILTRGGKVDETHSVVKTSGQFAGQFAAVWPQLSAQHGELQPLKSVHDMVSIAEGIRELGAGWITRSTLANGRPLARVNTPDTYPMIVRRAELTAADGATMLLQVSGGVTLEARVLALNDGDVEVLKQAVLEARPSRHALSWGLPLDGWEMPNDVSPPPPPAPQDQSEAATPDPGFSLTTHSYLLAPAGPSSLPSFLGFAAAAPVSPPGPQLGRFELPRTPGSRELGGIDMNMRFRRRPDKGQRGRPSPVDALRSRPSPDALTWPAAGPIRIEK